MAEADVRVRMKVLYLKYIFQKCYDAEHYISLPTIQKKLEEVGIKATRKTLYDDIELLQKYGMNIVLDRNRGYRLLDEKFTEAEIKVMADAMFAKGIKPSAYIDYPVHAVDYELIDAFN